MNAQVNELISRLKKHKTTYEINGDILIVGNEMVSIVTGRVRSGIDIEEM